jgi:hypothetical protein
MTNLFITLRIIVLRIQVHLKSLNEGQLFDVAGMTGTSIDTLRAMAKGNDPVMFEDLKLLSLFFSPKVQSRVYDGRN